MAVLAVLLGLELAKGKTIEQINSLGNFLIGVGGILTIVAAQSDLQQSLQNVNLQVELTHEVDDLKSQINQLRLDIMKRDKQDHLNT